LHRKASLPKAQFSFDKAEIKHAMPLAARRGVFVADGSKLARSSRRRCATSMRCLVVTDQTADPAVVAEIEATGRGVEIAR
jgi:DeoR/GlpR family transcriptional regulator of sugar metabolism